MSVQRNSAPSLPSLVVFADDWGRHPSSCQHLVRQLTNRWRILWVNTIGTRQVKADRFTFRRGFEKIRGWFKGLRRTSESMWVLNPPMLPMISRPLPRLINRCLVTVRIRNAMRRCDLKHPIVLTTLPYSDWLVGDIGACSLVYNCTDDYSNWPSADRDSLQLAEQQIRRKADLVLAASHKLAQLQGGARRCEYFPHAVDFEHFASVATKKGSPRKSGRLEAIPGPRIGYFGLIYEKLDFELLSKIACEVKGANLVLIGPVDYCPERFRALPNVHLVGKKEYDDLPEWLAELDVLLMPYLANDDMIQQSNPLKLRECLATGISTISIDIPEVRKLQPHVRVARDSTEFVQAIREALSAEQTSEVVAARQNAVRADSWKQRADELHSYLMEEIKRHHGGVSE